MNQLIAHWRRRSRKGGLEPGLVGSGDVTTRRHSGAAFTRRRGLKRGGLFAMV